MQKLIFDTHAHYTSAHFDADRTQLLDSLPQQGVALICECGTDFVSSKEAVALAESYPWIYAAVGIHPQNLIEEDSSTTLEFGGDWRSEMKAMAHLYEHPKVVAVGEVGLDNHWPVPKDAQLEMFEAHIRLSLELNLPLSIHDREAHADTYALLKKYKPKAVLHAFSGSAEDVKWLCKQGIYISFTGVATFKNAQKPLEAAAAVPSEYLLLETDCPYMAPVPFRGKRCDSGMIQHTAAAVAGARTASPESILQLSLANGKRFFGIG